MAPSFSETLRQARTERGMSKYALEKASGVPHANITGFESGARGVPTFHTVFDLAHGLGLDADGRRRFLESALGERLLDDLERFALYYYLALVSDDEVERVTREVRKQMEGDQHVVEALTRRGVRGHEPVLYDLVTAIAEMPELAHLRGKLAAMIVKTVTMDLEYGTVNLRPGEIAMDLLERPSDETGEGAEKRNASTRGWR